MNLDKVAESTFMRLTSRVAIMVVPFLMVGLLWFVQHEVATLEQNHTEEVAARTASAKVMWEQVGKMVQTQNDTVTKLTQVTTSFSDHAKDDDKFETTIGKTLDNIAQQIRDISVSAVRVVPATPSTVPPTTVVPPKN